MAVGNHPKDINDGQFVDGFNKVYLNEGGILQEPAYWVSGDNDITNSVVWGDVDGDGALGLADPIATLVFLFASGPSPSCEDAMDSNDDGELGLTDAIASLQRLFQQAPPLPAPSDLTIGPDPTPDGLTCE